MGPGGGGAVLQQSWGGADLCRVILRGHLEGTKFRGLQKLSHIHFQVPVFYNNATALCEHFM